LVAAGLSYFAIFSLLPLTLIFIAVIGFIVDKTKAESYFLSHVATLSTPAAADALKTLLVSASQNTGPASVLGVLLLLWASSRIFGQIQRALNFIWQAAPSKTYGLRRVLIKAFKSLRAITMTLLLGGMFIVVSLLNVLLALLQTFFGHYFYTDWMESIWPATSLIFSLIFFTCAFGLIYKWLPETKIHWREAWAGACVSAILFAFGHNLISIYFRHANVGSPFGAAGSVIVLLIWIYFFMQIFLFGAEFAWVYANRRVWMEEQSHSRNRKEKR